MIKMSKYITVVLAIAFIMLPGGFVLDHYGKRTLGAAYAEDGQAIPKVKFLKKKFNFGSVKKGNVISHDFTVMNEGNAVLKIVDLIPA
jgi:hypothetical protein